MQLSFTQTGEGKSPLVIMHGLFGSGRNWQGIAKQLSDRFTVFTLDLRNHGSSRHTDEMDYSSMAGDVIEFLECQGLADTTILGHSMGGKVAMNLALSQPDRVKSLIIVDIAPVAYKHNFDDILQALESVPVEKISSRKQADDYLAKKIDVLSLRQFLLQNLQPISSGGFKWRVNLKSIGHNMDAIMGFSAFESKAVCTRPTLFIKGEKSTYLSAKYQLVALELFPDAVVETIADAGHWPHVEAPVEFMMHLNQFLDN